MMSRPEGWVSWKEARVQHGLTYKVSELQIFNDNSLAVKIVLCLVGVGEDQGDRSQCSDSWTRRCLLSKGRHKVLARQESI